MSKLFKCGGCGYIHEGDSAPDVCPKCGAPKEKFAELTEDQAQLVFRSRKTNLLHSKLLVLLAEAKEIAQVGIADDLDPNCVKCFRDTISAADVLEGKIKAEIAGHVGKGKWG
jgi:rubredoxin